MAEVVGLIASVATLVEVVHKVQEYSHDYFTAKEQQDEISLTLNNLLTKIDLLDKHGQRAFKHPEDKRFEALRKVLKSSTVGGSKGEKLGPDPSHKSVGALKCIENRMRNTEAKLKSLSDKGTESKIRRMWWHHDKRNFQKTIAKIDESIKQVESVLAYDHFAISLDTNESVKELRREEAENWERSRREAAEERQRAVGERANEIKERKRIAIIDWLSPLSFQARQADLYNQCKQQNVSDPSLLTSPEFKAWASGTPWRLQCVGEPGTGKTFLCALVVEYLKGMFRDRNVPILCIYLNYKEFNIQTLDNLITSLLKQLLQHPNAEFKSPQAKRLFSGAENESRPTLEDFYEAFRAEIWHFER